MPRKFRTPASVAQNRDNQRRCRARQRESVEEMRKQLQEYELRGAQASIEMQRVAREVARENKRLRLLLENHGVSPEEIQTFLGLPNGAVGDFIQDQAVFQTQASTPGLPSEILLPTPSVPIVSHCQQNLPNHTRVTQLYSEDSHVQQLSDRAHVPCYQRDGMASVRRSPDPPTPTAPHDFTTASMETPCIVAADIITQLHGHKNAAEVLVALGCPGSSNCIVKNTRLFQLMDDGV
ncbi:uncharacterized protein F4822DRAFT_376457 [Hypoxylon trugodes]|uniref:uncharacterized protein n=1 Tax=Hypoxylon trugodes TaxID=326681 RepID=UPI00219F2D88|nr:uncharacterized protein F4822DRAFT_376457 [Hypoxylon trugodes]KAI1384889.1 hypothetical protein F4822DRAFT_376457 [Hypoxylon trugodes]